MLLDTLRENKFVISLAKKLFKLKKENPFVYKLLEVITDAIVLGLWIFASLGIALLMTIKGYTTLDEISGAHS